MTKSVFTPEYARLLELLVRARQSQGTTQQSLADRLGRSQSFVSKYESGERRLDLVEMMGIADCLQLDGTQLVGVMQGGRVEHDARVAGLREELDRLRADMQQQKVRTHELLEGIRAVQRKLKQGAGTAGVLTEQHAALDRIGRSVMKWPLMKPDTEVPEARHPERSFGLSA